MSDFPINQWVPPHVAAMDGYHAVEPVAGGPDVLKMDLNECQTPPSPRVMAALRAAVDGDVSLNWYPDSECTALRKAIGQYLNVPAEFVLVANGSNMVMELIARAFLAKDDPVQIVSPAYAVFAVQCKLQQARIEPFLFSKPFEPDFTELLAKDGTRKLTYLTNPNNPTGVGYPQERIVSLLKERRDSLIVLDEAYVEYYGHSSVGLIVEHPTLMVLRSFSKAFSLAGMRCGYVVAQPAVREILQRVLAPWAVSGLTQIAAHAALSDLDYMRRTVAECANARGEIVEGLKELGFGVYNTSTNFILWQVHDPAQAVKVLAARRVYVSNKDAVPQMKGLLRVTVGNTEQARRFLGIVQELRAKGLLEP
ncbi:MAG TPA: histidinol-phosphate transaminase [Verrucomicrobiae bacterium]|nr:histidinol-phosphate transaminase [Verrucomicrobiae bacterium]